LGTRPAGTIDHLQVDVIACPDDLAKARRGAGSQHALDMQPIAGPYAMSA
jgi:hypothetical protein